MREYCVSLQAEPLFDEHEVHDLTPGKCEYLPDPDSRSALGKHPSCKSALIAARALYPGSNGCAYCCPDCHTA
jgi:hypothetical protein